MTKRKHTIIVQFQFCPSSRKYSRKLSTTSRTDISHKTNCSMTVNMVLEQNNSAELTTVELVNRIPHSIDNKELLLAIYIDLSKAFDTLDHIILSNKLRYYGITGISLKWFMSYLSQRTQYVEVNGIQSSKMVILTGVPQRSILGPLLFLIYMNDIPSATEYFTFMLYADDTTLFSTMACCLPALPNEHNILINGERLKVNDWLVANRLSLNVNKTKCMIFHKS